MQTDLKLLLQKFSDGELTINMFIRKIRDISELSPKECNCKKLVIKELIIKEYLENQKEAKKLKHKEDNRKALKKWLSNPENKKKRSEKDKIRYQRNKAIGNKD